MTLTMYQASVPVFARYLNQLAAMVERAQEYAASNHIDPQSVLQARLAPSMYPFAVQVEIAVNFALRTCAPLVGIEVPSFGAPCESFAALQTRIDLALTFLATLVPVQMQGCEGHQFSSRAGLGTVSLEGPVFLLHYALPNFFFHLTTAYAILRNQGVALGKSDFDGFHVYGPVPPVV